jgi:type I restriction enzyme S subunit
MVFENYPYPPNWQLTEICDAYNFTCKPKGLNIKDKNGIPFYPMDCIPFDRLFPSAPIYKNGAEIKSGVYIENGDILLSKITPSFENGKQAIADFKNAYGYASTEIIPIKSKKGISESLFLFFLLKDNKVRSYLAGKMEGSTGRQRLNETVLKNFKIPLPPLSEQRKIAAILSTVQKAIENQQSLIDRTTELKKAMMHKLFTEGIKGEKQKTTEIGLVPESWEVLKFEKIVDFKTGKLNSNAAVPSGQYPFFTCSQETFWIDKYAFNTEAILLSGNNARAIYSVKYFKGKFNAYQRTYIITTKDKKQIEYVFLKHALAMKLEWLKTVSIGTSTKYLTLGILQNLQMALPDVKEQSIIGNSIDGLDRKLDLNKKKIKILEELFRTLLHQLMTAEIRIDKIDLTFLGVQN